MMVTEQEKQEKEREKQEEKERKQRQHEQRAISRTGSFVGSLGAMPLPNPYAGRAAERKPKKEEPLGSETMAERLSRLSRWR